MKTALLIALLASAPAGASKFDDVESSSKIPAWLKVSGLVDGRAYTAGREDSWLRQGTGRLRYGGSNGHDAARLSLSQASLVLDADLWSKASFHLHTNLTTDPPADHSPIGIFEAFLQADRKYYGTGVRARAGALMPLLSWEHPDGAWSTRYTLTPSAIGSWVGEDVRVFGVEAVAERPIVKPVVGRFTFGTFIGGDQIGRLLWYRSWALHDYQADIAARYSTPNGTIRPFSEIDGRAGYYVRGDVDILEQLAQVGAGYWTNNGHNGQGRGAGGPVALPGPPVPGPGLPGPNLIGADAEAYRTEVQHIGAKAEWKRLTVITQTMKVTIQRANGGPIDWSDAFLLASYQWKKWRASARYDRFWATNLDYGFAWTLFGAYDFDVRNQLAAEWVYLSARPGEPVFPRSQVDRLFQINYRLRF